MSKRSLISIILITLSVFIFYIYLNFNKDLRVAHAGGQFKDKVYVNSITAMESNHKFINYFEIDLQLTTDNRLICLHNPLSSAAPIHNGTFNELKNYILKNDLCYDEKLKKFLKQNKKIFIITDFKNNNLKGLNFIKEYFETDIHRFIPQIYYEDEYIKIKDLGFKNIIFTFYKIPDYSNDQIYKIIKKMDLFAITMNPARLRSGIVKKFDEKDFFIYVHTVNSLIRFIQYKLFFGADEIYTDNLF